MDRFEPNINLAQLDAMSSDDSGDDSDEKADAPGKLSSFMTKQEEKKKGLSLTDFEGFDNEDDDGSVAAKMRNLLALRQQLGMDDDASFMAEQERKAEEKKRIVALPPEERLKYGEKEAGDVMSRIKAKHAERMRQLEEREKEKAAAYDSDHQDEGGIKKKKKKKSKVQGVDGMDALTADFASGFYDSAALDVDGDGDGAKKKKKKKKSIDTLSSGEGSSEFTKHRKPRRVKSGGNLESMAKSFDAEKFTDSVKGIKKKKKSVDDPTRRKSVADGDAAKNGEAKKVVRKLTRRASVSGDGRAELMAAAASVKSEKVEKKKKLKKKAPVLGEDPV